MAELVPFPEEPLSQHLPTFNAPEYEDYVEAWMDVDRDMQDCYWKLAAVAASLVSKYGEDVTGKFGSDVGSSRRRIQEYARTYREWEKRERSRILSFHHHTLAIKAADPQKAIEAAEDEQLSTRELDKYVRTGELPSREVEEIQEAEEVESVGEMEIARIIKVGKMEYVVEYGDGVRHTVNRDALFEAGFKKCRHCSGRGIEERHPR